MFCIFVQMLKTITALSLACIFFASSILLPLSDFSLMPDLGIIYKTYKTVVKEEPGLIDFVGDYLLNGKVLLGHNKFDAPSNHTPGLQFQHQANTLLVLIFMSFFFLFSDIVYISISKPSYRQSLYNSGFYLKLFRPPVFAA